VTTLAEGRIALGMVGLGRMGANLSRRAMRDGHHVVAFDRAQNAVAELVADGAKGAASLAELVAALPAPRTVWVMVPAGHITESVVNELLTLLSPGDCIIDGGNSYYRDDIRRGQSSAAAGIDYLDVGTSGGVWGLERGYCLMIGGPETTVTRLAGLWDTIAPGFQTADRTPGRTGEIAPEERGWLHCGPGGAGHFVKMVHNGIEYGLMAAYAEGLNILKHAEASHAEVSLRMDGEQLHLRVQDDGLGFAAAGSKSDSGLGLIGMRERVQAVGGTLTIDSGLPRCSMILSNSATSRRPVIDVSGTVARLSFVKSSTTVRMRNRRPVVSWSATKSSDQRWFGPCGNASGARTPMARRRPRRRCTCSFSSPYSRRKRL
jgi:6-phosphogluconate dehydrogenase (decarboxylating)